MKKLRNMAVSGLVFAPIVAAQLHTGGLTADPGAPVDFSASTATTPTGVGINLPGTCAVGQQFFKSNNAAGTELYLCTATNTWTQLPSGGGGGMLDPGASGVVKRTALNATAVATATDVSALNYVAGSGTSQAQVATLATPITSLTTGLSVCWLPAAANTGAAPTLAVNGLAAKPITKYGTAALVPNDLTTTAIACAVYDGNEFQLQNPQIPPVSVRLNGGTVIGPQPTLNFIPGTGLAGFTGVVNGSQIDVTLPLDTSYTNTNYRRVDNSNTYVVGGGTAQAQTATYSPAIGALISGMQLCWLPANANSGPLPTFSPNGLAAHTIVKANGANLAANDLVTTAIACAIYDSTGTQWELQNPQTSASGGSGTANAAAQYDITYYSAAGTASTLSGAAISGLQQDSTSGPPTAATSHNVAAPLLCLDSSGSGTAQSCTTFPAFSPAAGDTIIYKTTTTNTGDVTINVNSSSAVHARKWQGTATFAAGDLVAGTYMLATYDGTYWEFYTIGNSPVGGSTTGSKGITVSGGNATFYDLNKIYLRDELDACQASTSPTPCQYGMYQFSSIAGTGSLDNSGGAGGPLFNNWNLQTTATSASDVIVYHVLLNGGNQCWLPTLSAVPYTWETRIRLGTITNNYQAVGIYRTSNPSTTSFSGFVSSDGIYCDVTNTSSAGNWQCYTSSSGGRTTVALSPAQVADTSEHTITMQYVTGVVTFLFDGTQVGTSTTNLPGSCFSTCAWETKTNTTAASSMGISNWRFFQ